MSRKRDGDRFFNLIFNSLMCIHILTSSVVFVYRKTASLGEMIQQLAPLGVAVPGGFGVTSWAYDAVLDQGNLRESLTTLLEDLDGK